MARMISSSCGRFQSMNIVESGLDRWEKILTNVLFLNLKRLSNIWFIKVEMKME